MRGLRDWAGSVRFAVDDAKMLMLRVSWPDTPRLTKARRKRLRIGAQQHHKRAICVLPGPCQMLVSAQAVTV